MRQDGCAPGRVLHPQGLSPLMHGQLCTAHCAYRACLKSTSKSAQVYADQGEGDAFDLPKPKKATQTYVTLRWGLVTLDPRL